MANRFHGYHPCISQWQQKKDLIKLYFSLTYEYIRGNKDERKTIINAHTNDTNHLLMRCIFIEILFKKIYFNLTQRFDFDMVSMGLNT